MKNTSSSKKTQKHGRDEESADEMLPEYDFDYQKARPNRFAVHEGQPSRTVILDPDIAEVFTTSEAVNIALRAFLSAIPKDFDMASQKKNAKNTREKLKV